MGRVPATPPPAGGRIGKRRRRLRVAAGILVAAAALATALVVRAQRGDRPEVRRPGERLEDVTDELSLSATGAAPTPVFTDVTAAAGLAGFRTFAGTRTSQLPEDMGSGAAWGDFDGDGDEDLFVVAAGGPLDRPESEWAPSLLFESNGDGTYRRAAGFPELRIVGMGAAWGDADADGDLDLAVSGYRQLLLFRNEGGGRFARDERFPAPDGFWAGISWADFDRDGDLDLHVCGYVRYEEPAAGERRTSMQYGAAVPYTLNPSSFAPERNLLLENRGDGSFDETAGPWGVANAEGRSLGALWHDFDDDGRLDLYVANDVSDNALFMNRGDTFEDVALAAWVADYRGAMGLAAGDWNRDGDDDLFVTHWLAQENALYDSRLADGRGREAAALAPAAEGARPARLTFQDLATPLGLGHVSLPLVGWGTELLDFDADGWLDVVVADGSTVEDPADRRRLAPQPPLLMWNRQGKAFQDLAPRVPALAAPRVGRGLAVADHDGDGDLDVLVVELDGGVRLLRNDTPQGTWLRLKLRQRLPGGGHGEAIGATAVAWSGGVPLRRSVTGASYLSQSSRILHFGLGAATGIDRLEVRWPGGDVATYAGLAAGALWQLDEGGVPRRVGAGTGGTAAGQAAAAAPLSRQQVAEFWKLQRAAMDAIKRDDDPAAAAVLLRQALAIDPAHEDSRYYLAHCLWSQGHPEEALAELDELRRRSPGSHRAHRQWASFTAARATGEAELAAAALAAEQALRINGEETGAVLLLGEIALLQGRPALAAERLAKACNTNPKAVGGFFLQAFVAWQGGEAERARQLLERARDARGDHWKPHGAAGEGDAARRMHRDATPLAGFWEQWDGGTEAPGETFAALAAYLAEPPARRRLPTGATGS